MKPGDPGFGDQGPGGARFGDQGPSGPGFGETVPGGRGSGDPGEQAVKEPGGPVPEGRVGPGSDLPPPAAGRELPTSGPVGPGPVGTGPVGTGPGGPIPGAPGAGEKRIGEPPGEAPRASRATTVILVTTLVVVVLITGVLGTIAVLMTRNPDMPLGGEPPRRLATPIHFAPVTEAKPGACTVAETYPDDLGQNCYSVAAGVTVNAVRKIEAIQEKSGAYSVRIAFAPAFREQINDLTAEAVNADDPVRQQIAIVVGQKVVAAPRVAQAITDDSLSIAGSFTKEQADAMVVKLLGSGGVVPQQPDLPQPSGSVFTPPADPGASQPLTPQGNQDQPVTPPADTNGDPAATNPSGTSGTSGSDQNRPANTPADTSANAAGEGNDRRFATCKAARENGYGPYTRGVHEEYQWYIDGDKDGVACELGDAG